MYVFSEALFLKKPVVEIGKLTKQVMENATVSELSCCTTNTAISAFPHHDAAHLLFCVIIVCLFYTVIVIFYYIILVHFITNFHQDYN